MPKPSQQKQPEQQKQHFIPWFLLKRFTPADQPPARPAASLQTKACRPDLLLNKIDLESSSLTQRPVSAEFALVEMYRDPGFDENSYHLETTLHAQIYPEDAFMFELHLLHRYMSFCQLQNIGEEFLLTENAFGIFEDPSTVHNEVISIYTEYHNFAPISPVNISLPSKRVLH